MSQPEATIRVNVDVTNPGQFFACCGLLELADRLWPGAEGWFEEAVFCVACEGTLRDVLLAAKSVTLAGGVGSDTDSDEEADEDDNRIVTPVEILTPVSIRLDWWSDISVKPWSGSMNVHTIALAMANAIDPDRSDPFSQCEVVYYCPESSSTMNKSRKAKPKKREPFYFDSLRGPNSHSRDVGFSTNQLKMKTTASPVVEFLCLIGLQRCRPNPTPVPRQFDFFTWTVPLPISVIPAAVTGQLSSVGGSAFRFRNKYRSDQKKLKAYMPAVPLSQGDDQ